jgi:hypothetical protein
VLKTIYREEPDETISKQKIETVMNLLNGILKDHDDEKDPHVKLHALMLLSQHYDLKGDFENALKFAESAVAHTPTYVEAYVLFEREAREPLFHTSLTHRTLEFEYEYFTRTPYEFLSNI